MHIDPPTVDLDRHRFIVCGDDSLAYRLAEEMVTRYGGDVFVILPDAAANYAPRIARLPSVRVIEAHRPDADALTRADVAGATAVALVNINDVGNVDAALVAHELNPDVRLVVRMFNMGLAEQIRRLLPEAAVLSATAIAAPAFIAAALGDDAIGHVSLPDGLLRITQRSDSDPGDVLCELAVTQGLAEPEVLPNRRGDLVLTRPAPVGPPPVRRQVRRIPLGMWFGLVGRRLWWWLAGLVGLLVVGSAALAVIRGSGPWEAFYLAFLNTFGGANPDLRASGAEQAVQVLLVVVSVALIPVITAAVVNSLVKARLAIATGSQIEPIEDHVVVVGLDAIGTRAVRSLHERGVPVVAIEKSPDALGVGVARELGIPLIVGDGSREESLRAASIGTARALMALTSDDVTNLQAALFSRNLHPDLRVMLRLFDGDFADRVQRAFGFSLSRSVSYLAAPAFAAAMLGPQVLGAISVQHRVLLVAEIGIGRGSVLEGRPVSAVDRDHESRLLAVRTGRDHQTLWSVPRARKLAVTDQIIVVATRAGLSRLQGEAAAGTNPTIRPAFVDDDVWRRLAAHQRPPSPDS